MVIDTSKEFVWACKPGVVDGSQGSEWYYHARQLPEESQRKAWQVLRKLDAVLSKEGCRDGLKSGRREDAHRCLDSGTKCRVQISFSLLGRELKAGDPT